MIPRTRTNEEIIEEAAKRAVKMALEESGPGTGSRVSQIIKQASKVTPETELEKEKEKYTELEKLKQKERQDLEKEKEELAKSLEENEVYCPTCSGHKHEHKLKKTDKGTLRCTGDGCSTEYALIPTNADYVCETCQLPHKKPKEDSPDDKCPFCGDNKFTKPKVDYNRIREKIAKRKK